MVAPVVFQPTLLDCWACRDFKRFRQVLKGGGAIVVHPAPQHSAGAGDNGRATAATDAVGSALSSSQPRSPAYSWGSAGNSFTNGLCPPSEVNRRDYLGRTVLHLIASSAEPSTVDYLTVLLAHPGVNVNLQDQENGWTALHRSLYHGNLQTALTLLKRSPPADVRIKDFEGLTAFDLYNSTVHGTNPPAPTQRLAGELYTWGANRNFTLGLGTSDDRALPDKRALRREDVMERSGGTSGAGDDIAARLSDKEPGAKFDRVSVVDIGMSKFATVVLTAERSNNVWVCGIGTTGRIGRAPQTQPFLEPLRDFSDTAAQISVGPDHTCIVTTDGDLYTFGFNRFHQLGYPLEHGFGSVSSSTKGGGGAASTTFGGASIPTADLDIQISPRKILGSLKKEVILGAAAGKLHSAAYTSDSLFTWGTNTGQLGYDRAATPVQPIPRKVAAISANVTIIAVAVSDFATACLTGMGDVLLLHNDTSFFVRFPQLTLGSQASVYRPRQARPKPFLQSLVGGPNNSFAAISDIGEVWQFTAGHPSEYAQPSGTSTAAKAAIKPQLIWSVRKNKKVGAARDVAMGSGSDMILVTESGHVFVRSRKAEPNAAGPSALYTPSAGAASSSSGSGVTSAKGKSGWKPVPYLQRVVKVATNESGGWAAVKTDAMVRELRVRGRDLEDDLGDALPHLRSHVAADNADKEGDRIVGDLADAIAPHSEAKEPSSDDDDSDIDQTGDRYIRIAQTIAEAARRWNSDEEHQKLSPGKPPPLGCDMYVHAGGRYLPAHRSIISARLPVLAPLLNDPPSKGNGGGPAGISIRQSGPYVIMTLTASSFGTAMFLLHYLYTDDLPAVWAASIGMRVEKTLSRVKISPPNLQSQLRILADDLQLDALAPSLSSPVPRAPRPTLASSLQSFFDSHVETPQEQSPFHDVLIHFADRRVPAHSVLLRRSPFFAAFFQPHWTSTRWQQGVIEVDMVHVRWEVARVVMLHLYTDKLFELFRGCDSDRTHDQYIDFVIEVLAFANELLLDKFKLVCCQLLRQRVAATNVAALITDANFYNALAFKESLMDYASRTMETLLESGMLDDLENRMVKHLTKLVRARQDERLHRTRADEHLNGLIVKHHDYFFDLDIPPPSLGIAAARVPKRQPRASTQRASPRCEAQGAETPTGQLSGVHQPPQLSTVVSPELRATGASTPSGTTQQEESMMFSMDDDETGASRSPASMSLRVPAGDDVTGDFNLPPPAERTFAGDGAAPWKSRSVEAGKAAAVTSRALDAARGLPSVVESAQPQDLRSIMAAEQSRSRPSDSLSPGVATPQRPLMLGSVSSSAAPQASAARMSQKDRKKQRMAAIADSADTQSALSQASASAAQTPAPSPWKAVDVSRASPLPPSTPLRPSLLASQTPPATASPAARQQAPASQMGPTITPTRMRSATQRRTPSGMGEPGGGQVWGSSASSVFGSSPSGRLEVASNNISPANGPAWSVGASPAPAPPALNATIPIQSTETPARGKRSSSSAAASGLPSSTTGPAPTNPVAATGSAAATLSAPKSFAEIQAEELRRYEELAALQQARAPRSFAELQEEDRRESERKRVEEQRARDFEREFEEESRRVQAAEQQRKAKAKVKGAKRGGGGNKSQGSSDGSKNGPVAAGTEPKEGGGGGRKGRKGGAGGGSGGSNPSTTSEVQRTTPSQRGKGNRNPNATGHRRGGKKEAMPAHTESSSAASGAKPPAL